MNGRSAHGLQSGLAEIIDGFAPHLAAHRVMRELLRVLGKPIGAVRLDGAEHAGVERKTIIREQARIGHLVRERMFEAIELVCAVTALVQILEPLELAQVVLRRRDVRNDRFEETYRHVTAQD